MERKTLVTKLRTLRQEFDGILDAEVPVALILADICDALELSQAEHDFVLGKDVAEAIEEWKSARVWPTEKETATLPLTELVAAPV